MAQKIWPNGPKKKFLQSQLTWNFQEIHEPERDLGVTEDSK